MNWDDAELKLLVGIEIEVDGLGRFHSPKIKDVAKIGESTYNEYLSALLFSKENIDEEFSGEFNDYQLFCILYTQIDSFNKRVNNAFKFFLNAETYLDSTDGTFYLVCEDKVDKLNEENFYIMQEHIRFVNSIQKPAEEEQYKPANEEAAKMIKEMLERRRKKPKPKPIIDLRSIVSGMGWKCPSVDISEKTIFQLYDGFRRLQNLDSLYYTMLGIYTGNVDSKKINMKDLNFALILKD